MLPFDHSKKATLLGVGFRFALRRVRTEAIETFRPDRDAPVDSKSRRVYHILRRRYTEQASQRELAMELSLSIRQLQREEKRSCGVLADHLWAVHVSLASHQLPMPADYSLWFDDMNHALRLLVHFGGLDGFREMLV